MTFQAYLDTIKSKTGKTPDDFRQLAARKKLTQYRDVMTWLKKDFDLGHGHANAIAQLLVNADKFKSGPEERIARLFAGNRAKWRPEYERLVAEISAFGADVKIAPTNTYISFLRGRNKFSILQPSSAGRIDIGIKLKGIPATLRFESAGAWNNMVTHRVRITSPGQFDTELLTWLKQAYQAA